MPDSPPSQMTRVPTPLIPAVRELSRLHRQGRTPQILKGLQSLISAIDSNTSFNPDLSYAINLDSTAIAELTGRIEKLEMVIADINTDNTAIAKVTERLSSLETELRKLVEPATLVELLPQTEGAKRSRKPTPPEPLIQSRLAERLGVDTSTLTRRRERDDFRQWVQNLDPDGIGWEYNCEEQQFYPV